MLAGASLPFVLTVPYFRHLLVTASLNVALALSFDLLAGHIGAVSLAHPAFFGVGAYIAAVMNTRVGASFLLTLPMALLGGATLAVLLGVPLFRLSDLSFAIGTLGLSLVAQTLANNWVSLTGGPMCTTNIAPPWRALPGGALSPQVSSYYIAFTLAVLVAVTYHLLTTFRLGRALAAVQSDEVFASSFGINPLRYKVLIFAVSGMVAAAVGGFYAHYTTVFCPADMSTFLTTNLLVMVFVGGLGSLRGVVVGAVLFTTVPEMSRFAREYSQLIYGLLLLLVIVYAPDGLETLFKKWKRA
jgi:branched-chain amino acid transport system permease protein